MLLRVLLLLLMSLLLHKLVKLLSGRTRLRILPLIHWLWLWLWLLLLLVSKLRVKMLSCQRRAKDTSERLLLLALLFGVVDGCCW